MKIQNLPCYIEWFDKDGTKTRKDFDTKKEATYFIKNELEPNPNVVDVVLTLKIF